MARTPSRDGSERGVPPVPSPSSPNGGPGGASPANPQARGDCGLATDDGGSAATRRVRAEAAGRGDSGGGESADGGDSAESRALHARLFEVGELVEQLAGRFREQVKRAVGVELDDSQTALAFADHYLRLAHDEHGGPSGPVAELLAAGAGAFFGELVRREIGATWIGDRNDPRRLRLLIAPFFVHFSPVDQSLEAIFGEGLSDEDSRLPAGIPFDPAFHFDERMAAAGEPSDAEWLAARLAELPPVRADEYYTLTCRFETLKLMLELLAARHAARGDVPRDYGVAEYLAALHEAASV